MNYTQQLLNEIGFQTNQPDAQHEDEFKNIDTGDFVSIEYPTGLWHLLKILWNLQEKKAFALSNPDGYFYLLYLKTIMKFLLANFLTSGLVMMAICYYSNNIGKGDLNIDNASSFDLTSIAFSIDDQLVYYVSLIMTIFTTVLAYFFMFDFCDEMTKFEF
jgi:hypothetical protein